MKNNSKGSSLVEVMVIMLIIVSGVTGMYSIYGNSQKISNNLDMKIQAVQIAREGIEAMTNIRDTNWKMFSTDRKNCWNTLNYNINCVGDNVNASGSDIAPGSYTMYQDSDYRWKLKLISALESDDYKVDAYRTNYKVYEQGDGFYSQPDSVTTETPTNFTREIILSYSNIDDSGARYSEDTSITDSDQALIKVVSKVMWTDSSRQEPYSVQFETYLSNWKALK